MNPRLRSLYSEIHQCHICPDMDQTKEIRNPDAISEEMDIFIISQALAEGQLRMSGVNFFQNDGALGSTGRQLEQFLNLFDRTVYPPREVTTPSGSTISGRRENLISVYNTEIAQCFPGRSNSGSGDRPPTGDEMRTCVNMGYIREELQIIRPKLVILMGKKSWSSFHQIVLQEAPAESTLTGAIESICSSGNIPEHTLSDGITFCCLPIQHASGANPRFYTMLRNESLVDLIEEVLDA